MKLVERLLKRVGLDEAVMNEPIKCLAKLARLLRVNPTNAEYWSAAGAVHWLTGQSQHALRALRLVTALAPQDHTSRAFLGQLLIEQGELLEGATMYRKRWLDTELAKQMRYPPSLMWSGECCPGMRLLLWESADLDEGLMLIRLAPLLSARGMVIGVDLPALPLAVIRRCWPQIDPTRGDGKFDAHFPISDLLCLWRDPTPAALYPTALPLPMRLDMQGELATVIGVAIDVAIADVGQAALIEAVRSSGANTIALPAVDGGQLVNFEAPIDQQVHAVMTGLASVDAVVTTSILMAHLASLAHKPVLFLASPTASHCWGAGGRSQWYENTWVLRRFAGENWRNVLLGVPHALNAVLRSSSI